MITLSKIAQLAHVSVSTASKAFSMSSEVSEQTRNEIFKIAKEYGCFKKFYNAKYPKYVIAVICPEFHGQYYSGIVASLQSCLGELGCEVCVASTEFSGSKEYELLEYYHHYSNVDGIVVIGGQTLISSTYEIPLVSVMPVYRQPVGVCLHTDYMGASDQIVAQLKANGVEDIAFIGETRTGVKLEGFHTAMEKNGLNCKCVIVNEERFEQGGYLAMDQLLQRQELPQAVICAYDHMAIGAMKRLSEAGISVPGDMLLAGLDNIPESAYLVPSLTSVDFGNEAICRQAAQCVVDMLNGKEVEKDQHFSSQVHFRQSTEKTQNDALRKGQLEK